MRYLRGICACEMKRGKNAIKQATKDCHTLVTMPQPQKTPTLAVVGCVPVRVAANSAILCKEIDPAFNASGRDSKAPYVPSSDDVKADPELKHSRVACLRRLPAQRRMQSRASNSGFLGAASLAAITQNCQLSQQKLQNRTHFPI